jgi:twitching motility protein PilT
MARLDALLRQLRDEGGSDLHLAAGLEPRMRRRGHLEPVAGAEVLGDAELRGLLAELASEAQWREYEAAHDLDFAHAIHGVARFRANYLVQENGCAAVFRIVPERVMTAEELCLPLAVTGLAELAKGLVLVTGPTGSGKSTTLAAIIDRINRTRARHVVTIEDPIEFVHRDQRAVFSQREVGPHTGSFAAALRAVLRQDADVVLVGEMRDRETIGLAITAAEMGLLVFGTLHTNGAAKTIDRVIDAFPAKEQDQVRISLSESLAAVVSQLLVPLADGRGRLAVHEILLRTPGLANVIREGNTPMLHSIIQAGKGAGMQAMDDALFAAAREGRVRPEDAQAKAHHKARFQALVADGAAAS